MIYSKENLKQFPWITTDTILVVKAGSRAYGLHREDSDYDLRGLFIAPKTYYLGFLNSIQQLEMKAEGGEGCLYSLPRFFQLAADNNPNILEILYSEVLYEKWPMAELLYIRDDFLSKKARYTFSGYAIAQLKRINTHRKWLLDPPKGKPDRAEFGLAETSLLSKDIMGAIQKVATGDEDTEIKLDAQFPAHVMDLYQKERAYHNAMRHWSQFCTWKENRNVARAVNETKFGYDTKHAMHLVRLMRMCEEILQGKGVIVNRPDREELMEVRDGRWSYEKLIEFATTQDEKMDELYKTSPLPREPDRQALHNFCVNLTEQYYGG